MEQVQINVLVADDHKLLLTGLARALEDEGINIAAKTNILADVIPLYIQTSPDVVILDINFGHGRNGLDILRELLESYKDARVIMYSQYDQNHLVEQAYKQGAMGYLNKLAEVDEIVDAIRTVFNTQMYFQKGIADNLALAHLGKPVLEEPDAFDRGLSNSGQPVRNNGLDNIEEILSPKELEIFKLMAKGMTQAEMVKHLEKDPEKKMSERTIQNIYARIKQKLNVNNLAELAILAYKSGYV